MDEEILETAKSICACGIEHSGPNAGRPQYYQDLIDDMEALPCSSEEQTIRSCFVAERMMSKVFKCDTLEELAKMIQSMALCGLGKSAPLPVLSTLATFRDEYVEHIVDKRCRAKQCTALRRYVINPAFCKGCSKCARNCPASAIHGTLKSPYTIAQDACIRCGSCVEQCAFGAITVEK